MTRQKVTGPVAVLVIGVALVLFAVVFGRGSFAPESKEPFQLPYEPPTSDKEMGAMRQGLEPLGIGVVWPPLNQDRGGKGLRVAWVTEGKPGQAAGLQEGDLIEKFNGQPIGHFKVLVVMVNQVEQDASYPVEVVRAGQRKTVTVRGLKPLDPEEYKRLPL